MCEAIAIEYVKVSPSASLKAPAVAKVKDLLTAELTVWSTRLLATFGATLSGISHNNKT